jgi:hypothetical protein
MINLSFQGICYNYALFQKKWARVLIFSSTVTKISPNVVCLRNKNAKVYESGDRAFLFPVRALRKHVVK